MDNLAKQEFENANITSHDKIKEEIPNHNPKMEANTEELAKFQTSENTCHVNLDEMVKNALEKVKEFFVNSENDEQKLTEFILKILSLSGNDMDFSEFKMSPELLDQIINQMIQRNGEKLELNNLNEIINNVFVPEKMCSQKIDDVVESLLGPETKKLVCEKLGSENLDELFNKLVNEKFHSVENPQTEYPKFDEFLEKVLGKETEEFIKKKLQEFLNASKNINVTDVSDVD